MPSPARKKMICVFGDSHIGCVKMALNDGLFKPRKGLEIEFWGAEGPVFRRLEYTDGKVVPLPDALPVVLAVNGQGREALDPENYDAVLFMAARIRSLNLFEPELHRMQQPGAFVSEAVFYQNCKDWLRQQKYYRVARDFAKISTCKIFVAPSTFLIEGAEGYKGPKFADCQKPNVTGIDRLWTALEQIAAEDGITLIRQPPETCADGCTTKPEYCSVAADGSLDPTHRNATYGALILNQVAAQVA